MALHALNAGCSDDAAGTDAGVVAAAGTGVAAGTGAAGLAGSAAGSGASGDQLSFERDVYERVMKVRCANCHNDGPSFGGLAFFPGAATAYANLVNVPAGSESNYLCRASGLLRVKPGDPEHSLIYLKLTMPPCGSKMPPLAFGTVTEEQVSLVRKWIADGAAP